MTKRRRLRPMTTTAHPTSFRRATAGDAQTLRDLALLDSARTLTGDVLVAEVGGTTVAALSLDDHRVVADPFAHTSDVSELLRDYAARVSGDSRARRSAWSLLPQRRHLQTAA